MCRRLKFSFRFQPWVDVLNWFAEQADLSLVLDAPPPGTFNYTDSREYSVPEAIDLLNGVLLTKGYTLLRRERMLMVLDLTDGVPADLVPRISLDEIDRRGRFELVSVVFPLGERNAEEVKTEIAPLLGPHGKTAVLPKTKQILVTDTAGKMRAIRAVISSIPQPDAAAVAGVATPAGSATLAVYPLAGLDAKATLDILTVLFSDAKFVHDPKADQIVAHGMPDRQAAVQAVLTQLRADHPAEKKPRLVRHPIKQSGREQLMETLKLAVPESVLRIDADTGELLAWATPAQQEIIAKQIIELGRTGSPQGERQLEVHPIKQADPAGVLALLQKSCPTARLAIDAPRSLVALAAADDQRAIRATIEQIESRGAEKPTLHTYPLTADQPKRADHPHGAGG